MHRLHGGQWKLLRRRLGLFFAALAQVVAWCSGAGSRPAATPFLLLRQKKWGKEKTTPAAGLSGRTRYATASLRSNNRRKSEFCFGVRDACAHGWGAAGVTERLASMVLIAAGSLAERVRADLPLSLCGMDARGEKRFLAFGLVHHISRQIGHRSRWHAHKQLTFLKRRLHRAAIRILAAKSAAHAIPVSWGSS